MQTMAIKKNGPREASVNSYSLSLICQPDIRGHEAPHHQWLPSLVDDHVSQVSRLSYGVLQGAVLGPVLFILNTEPLYDLI